MALIYRESIDTDLVAVSSPLNRLFYPVVTFFTRGLEPIIGTPE
jgi:hypothetical protein